MANFKTMSDVESELQKYYKISPFSASVNKLERISSLAKLLGNPQDNLKIIHVAGTSGKTSTCYNIRAKLESAGFKTGMIVSPHIDTVRERVQISGKPISEEQFIGYINKYINLVKKAPVAPSYFEFMVMFALWFFEKERVDYAVVEVGIGGLYDSTNICRRKDKICVITDIGFDHQEILGDSITEIAEQKSGIIWSANKTFIHRQSPEVMQAVEARIQAMSGSSLEIIDDDNNSNETFPARNENLAHYVYSYISKLERRDFDDTRNAVCVPGRMDTWRMDEKTLVIDGAHNLQKLNAFWKSYRDIFPDSKPVAVVSLKQGKDIAGILDVLAKNVEQIVFTEFEALKGTGSGPVPSNELSGSVKINSVSIPNLHEAIDYSLKQSNDDIIIVGSLYLASDARKIVKRMSASPFDIMN